MRLLTVNGTWKVRAPRYPGAPHEIDAALAIKTPGRWLRIGAFYGTAPGSRMTGRHVTAWPTRIDDMRGWNARLGWWPQPCVTLLAHTRPVREDMPDRPCILRGRAGRAAGR